MNCEIEIGGYFFKADEFVFEHIRLLEGELDDACKSVVEKSKHIDYLNGMLRRAINERVGLKAELKQLRKYHAR